MKQFSLSHSHPLTLFRSPSSLSYHSLETPHERYNQIPALSYFHVQLSSFIYIFPTPYSYIYLPRDSCDVFM